MNIQDYSLLHSTPDSPAVASIIPSTVAQHEMPQMIAGATVARLLQILLTSLNAKRALEIGCFTGYTALSMAEVLPEDGQVITLEVDPNNAAMAARHLEKSEHGPKVTVILGKAADTLLDLEPGFDLAFIDADKTKYPLYLEAAYLLVRQGGVIALDNTWLEGTVVLPNGPAQAALADLNGQLAQDKRFICVMLPVRDGLTLLYKK